MLNVNDTVYIPSELSSGIIVNRSVQNGIYYEVKIKDKGPFLFREDQLKPTKE